jgi:Ca2+/Na+ antiporter
MGDPDELRYNVVVDTYSREMARTDGLDAKISNAIGTSGTLMTLFLGLGTFMLEKISKTNQFMPFLQATLILGLTLFTSDLFLLLTAYRLKKYRVDPNPRAIIEKFGNYEYSKLLLQLTSNMADGTASNRELNNRKASSLTKGFYMLLLAILLVVAFGILLVKAISVQ